MERTYINEVQKEIGSTIFYYLFCYVVEVVSGAH